MENYDCYSQSSHSNLTEESFSETDSKPSSSNKPVQAMKKIGFFSKVKKTPFRLISMDEPKPPMKPFYDFDLTKGSDRDQILP